MSNKEVLNLIRRLEDQNWECRRSRTNSHYRCKPPSGRGLVFIPTTPSDWRSLANTIADCRRAGAQL